MSATERLFWQDPYQRHFRAWVMETLTFKGQPAAVLDRTCFYPTSGGQPHDLGTLGGIPVVEVLEEEGGKIIHLLERPLMLGPVEGEIDWSRRFDHMQQHTGQHILSQAFERELNAATTSFHLGSEVVTIDVAIPTLSPKEAARVEALANRIVIEDRPVHAKEYDEEEASSLPLRKAPVVHGRIRIVEVEGFDLSACGGTHVRRTGEVGPIHIRRWERRRGQVRVEFLCGWRALEDYAKRDRLLQEAANQLSVGTEELSEAIQRLQKAEQLARRTAESLRKRLLDYELPQLLAEAEPLGEMRVLCRLLEGYDAGNMRYIAQNLTQTPGIVALLAVNEPSPQLCFARSENLPLDMSQLLRQVVAPYGGRGGGRSHVAQGGGVAPEDLEQILQKAKELLR